MKQKFREFVPSGCAWAISPIASAQSPLFPGEIESIAKAVLARQIEFRAGRSVARDALTRLGVTPTVLPRAPDRRPLWPEGVVGTIAHSGGWVGAIVGRKNEYTGIGLDFEPLSDFSTELRSIVLSGGEITSSTHIEVTGAQIDVALLTFVIKEAAFKAVYPITQRFFAFDAACVRITDEPSLAGASGGKFYVDLLDETTCNILGRSSLSGLWFTAFSFVFAMISLKLGSGFIKLPARDAIG